MAELTPNQRQFTFPNAISPNIPVSVSSYNFQTSIFGTGSPGYGVPSMYANPTIGPYDQAKGSNTDKLPGVCSPLIKAHHATSYSQPILSHSQGGAGPSGIIDLCDSDSSTSNAVDSEPTHPETATVFLKVLNPLNKKQVLNMHTLRDFSCELHTPDDLREEIFCRLGESEISRDLQFDFGYYKQGKKLWLNSAQDVRDAWSLLSDGGRLTFWCNGVLKVETTQPTRKQASNSEADGIMCTKRKRVCR